MEKWLEPLGNKKEYRQCEACRKSSFCVFFLWHSHPSIANFYVSDPLIVCTTCCKREAGDEYYKKKIKEYKVNER